MSRKWIAWSLMILSALLFSAADVFAATQEGDGQPVTASSWVRRAIHRCPLLGVVLVALVVWHFIVQAWYPGLPL